MSLCPTCHRELCAGHLTRAEYEEKLRLEDQERRQKEKRLGLEEIARLEKRIAAVRQELADAEQGKQAAQPRNEVEKEFKEQVTQ